MDLDTLEKIAEKIKQSGYEYCIQECEIEECWEPVEAMCVGGDVVHFPGRREVQLNIRAVLIEKDPHLSHLDEIKEAIRRFDQSVKPFTENY